MRTPTLDILEAVNGLVERARAYNPGTPEVSIVLGASGKSGKSRKHGHFAPKTWRLVEDDSVIHEIMLSGESLERGAEATLGTILHELAHAYCFANDIKDTSNGGHYHNAKFKEQAETFGIEVAKAGTIGWSATTVPAETADLYREGLDVLNSALKAYRIDGVMVESKRAKRAKRAKKHTMQCPVCQEPVATSKKWFLRHKEFVACMEHADVQYFELLEDGETYGHG